MCSAFVGVIEAAVSVGTVCSEVNFDYLRQDIGRREVGSHSRREGNEMAQAGPKARPPQ